MRYASRVLVVSVLLVIAFGCAYGNGPTRPAAPPERSLFGSPRGLTFSASPTTIAQTGSNVQLTGQVVVDEGLLPPIALSVQLPGESSPSLLPLDRGGRLNAPAFLTHAGDIIARAGELERRVSITQQPAPALPDPSPGPPLPPPAPAPPPPPAPTPVPSLSVTVSASPQTAVLAGGQATVTFTARATPLHGAGAVMAFEWDFNGDGAFDSGEVTSSGSRVHTYTAAGLYNVTLRATTVNGITGQGTVAVAIATARNPILTAQTF